MLGLALSHEADTLPPDEELEAQALDAFGRAHECSPTNTCAVHNLVAYLGYLARTDEARPIVEKHSDVDAVQAERLMVLLDGYEKGALGHARPKLKGLAVSIAGSGCGCLQSVKQLPVSQNSGHGTLQECYTHRARSEVERSGARVLLLLLLLRFCRLCLRGGAVGRNRKVAPQRSKRKSKRRSKKRRRKVLHELENALPCEMA